jgi:hypothetical protein
VSELAGIFQTDIVLQSALKAGLADLKANTWLLDYIWSSLPSDPQTAQLYGQMDVNAAKKWFLAQTIPVFLNTRVDTFRGLCLTIAMSSSAEVENTLADNHYVPSESIAAPVGNVALTAPFTPQYNSSTGVVTIPTTVGDTYDFFPGMYLVSPAGTAYKIIDVTSDYSLTLAPGLADLTNVTLQATLPTQPSYAVRIGSVECHEVFQIGCHVVTDPFHLVLLHSVVVFILLRYRKTLLEARGLERTKFESEDFGRDESLNGELAYRRYITLDGYVRHFWPMDNRVPQAVGGVVQLKNIDVPNMPADSPPATQLWIGDQDTFNGT